MQLHYTTTHNQLILKEKQTPMKNQKRPVFKGTLCMVHKITTTHAERLPLYWKVRILMFQYYIGKYLMIKVNFVHVA